MGMLYEDHSCAARERSKQLRSVAVLLRYKQRVKDKVEPCAGTLRYADT